jgi:hypothetical protein
VCIHERLQAISLTIQCRFDAWQHAVVCCAASEPALAPARHSTHMQPDPNSAKRGVEEPTSQHRRCPRKFDQACGFRQDLMVQTLPKLLLGNR